MWKRPNLASASSLLMSILYYSLILSLLYKVIFGRFEFMYQQAYKHMKILKVKNFIISLTHLFIVWKKLSAVLLQS